MRDYARLARILNAEDVADYIEEAEKKVKNAVEKGEDFEIDPDFEKKVRDRLKEIISEKFDNRSLEVLKSLSVIDIPIDIEIAKKIYDLDSLKAFYDLGLIENRNGYLIIDPTLKDLIREDKEEYHRKAIKYYENLDETIETKTEKAYHYLMIKDYAKAFEHFISTANEIYGRHRCVEKLIFIGEKLVGKVKEMDRLLGTLGNLYMVLKKYREAEHYYKRVLEMYKKSGDERILGVMLNLANLYYVRGEYKKAEESLKECLSLSLDKNEEITENALLILSSLYLDLNEFEKAESCLIDVLRIEHARAKKEPERLRSVASIVNNLGFVYSRSKNFEKAEKFYKEALRIYNELNDVKGVVTALNNLCSVYITTENFEKAKEILRMLENISDIPPDLKAKYHFLKAKVLERERCEDALLHYAKAGALGFLVFRNFGMNAINYMHAFDKAEEVARKLGKEEFAGDMFVIKSVIGKVYFGVRKEIGEVECGERGKVLLRALKGEDVDVKVNDEIDSAVFVILRDFLKSR